MIVLRRNDNYRKEITVKHDDQKGTISKAERGWATMFRVYSENEVAVGSCGTVPTTSITVILDYSCILNYCNFIEASTLRYYISVEDYTLCIVFVL